MSQISIDYISLINLNNLHNFFAIKASFFSTVSIHAPVKAQAFSYKLVISNDIKEKSSLKKLLVLVKENKYQEALSFAKEIKEGSNRKIHSFLWKTPKRTGLQLKSVSIMSLLEKGENMGSIEKVTT